MVYAKYISESQIEPFEGNILSSGGVIYVNPTKRVMKQNGYLPVVSGQTVMCKIGYERRVSYVKEDDRIIENQYLVEKGVE